jgi:PiT family inorganic phosphate transporter
MMWKTLSGVFMGWTLGANDSANIFGTGVATGTIRYGTAIVLTALFVLVGSVCEGSKCVTTLNELSRLLPITAFSCTLATALTMTVLTYLGIPASASQGIVGAIIGASIWFGSPDFSRLYKIVTCWVLTPICAVIVSYCLHRLLTYVLDRTVTSITYRNMLYTFGIAAGGCYAAYCLGSNNVANVTGVYVGAGLLSSEAASLIGGLSIAGGVLTYSGRVMETVGKGIAPLSPFSALVCVLATGLTLHVFTQIGVPVSSSQAVVGTVVGVGFVGGMRTVSGRMLAKIVTGWALTPVAAGILSLILTKLIA